MTPSSWRCQGWGAELHPGGVRSSPWLCGGRSVRQLKRWYRRLWWLLLPLAGWSLRSGHLTHAWPVVILYSMVRRMARRLCCRVDHFSWWACLQHLRCSGVCSARSVLSFSGTSQCWRRACRCGGPTLHMRTQWWVGSMPCRHAPWSWLSSLSGFSWGSRASCSPWHRRCWCEFPIRGRTAASRPSTGLRGLSPGSGHGGCSRLVAGWSSCSWWLVVDCICSGGRTSPILFPAAPARGGLLVELQELEHSWWSDTRWCRPRKVWKGTRLGLYTRWCMPGIGRVPALIPGGHPILHWCSQIWHRRATGRDLHRQWQSGNWQRQPK